jgi:phosphoribosylanthranilate isomerase
MPVRVKVCGLTDPDNARAVAALGIDEIGLNFWPGSPRCVTPARAREIMAVLPPGVGAVGVFVDAPGEEVDRIAANLGLAALQLHGGETPDYAAARRRPVIRAVRSAPGTTAADLSAWRGVTLLVDGWHPDRPGGTGRAADPDLARELVRAGFRLYLAGGLGPGNVAAAAAVGPYAVDLNSGIESAPGIKDPARLAEALAALGRPPRPREEQA